MRCVHFVLPNNIDDPARPSGGNVYDRHIIRGLAAAGWSVREHPVRGAWPHPSATDRLGVAHVLAALPDRAVVLVDGMIGSAVPDLVVEHARRLQLSMLVHMLFGDQNAGLRSAERRALAAAATIVTTSSWSRRRVLELYPVSPERVHVAFPGVEPAPVVSGSDTGSQLLCVAAVAPHKGHDVLIDALATIRELSWSCVCVGPLDRDPAFVDRMLRLARERGIAERLRFVGVRAGRDLDAGYAAADLLVLPSRGETYGMVVTEALARGIPAVAAATNGVPEALGRAPDGTLPGILVPPADAPALATALRAWLGRPDLRHELRRSARARRTTLPTWAGSAELVSAALSTITPAVSARR